MATRSLTTACSRRRPGRIIRAAAAEAEALRQQTDGGMRRALSLTLFASAVGAPFVTDGNWMLLSLTPFMLGRATLMCATSPSLAGIRGRLRLSQVNAPVAYALAYTAAGIWLAIAALVQLERGLAVVVALAALLWSALWGWAATRMRAESSRATP